MEQNPLVAWVGSNKYNAFNELVSTKGAGGSIESRYNGEGYRTVKTANGQTTYGLYEGDKLVLETDSSGKEKVRTVYGLNAISRTDNGDKAFYLYNPHADVVNLVSGSSIVATYAYDAFGVPVSGEEWSGVNDSKNAGIRFGGYQYDPESGYYYLNARMYDPKTARFLQEDSVRGTLEDPLSLNLYTYCQNDPVNYWDPTGHQASGIYYPDGSFSPKSIDPSGTYYTDGSFTPKGTSTNNGGSGGSSNTGTVSKEVMDAYYAEIGKKEYSGSDNSTVEARTAMAEAAQTALGLSTANKVSSTAASILKASDEIRNSVIETNQGKVPAPNILLALRDAAFGCDSILGNSTALKYDSLIKAEQGILSKVVQGSKRISYAKKLSLVAKKADKFGSVARTIGKNGARNLGIFGAVVSGIVQIDKDLNNKKFTKEDKKKAVFVDVVQTAASIGAVFLSGAIATALLPAALVTAGTIVIGIGLGTGINYLAQKRKDVLIDNGR